MITVTNRFLVKKGFAHKMAPLFISDKNLLNWEGFNKVEVNVCSEPEDHDEMNVMMFWDTVEQFIYTVVKRLVTKKTMSLPQ